MGIGFFGGFGFSIKVFNDQFIGNFYEYAEDVMQYKTHLNDKAFSSSLVVNNKYQYLILSERPTLQFEQQLNGLITFTSNDYYEINYDEGLDTNSITGKIYFTCKTSPKTK